MEWIIKEKYEGMDIRDFLKDVHKFSNRILTDLKFNGGSIRVNGFAQKVCYRLSVGDILTIKFPPEEKGPLMIPEDVPLSIIYEDQDLIIINKSAGMVITPTPLHPSGTIANGLLAYYEKYNIPYTVHVVTRLDRDTSGILLIAKHRYCHSLLARSMEEGMIDRTYKAVVEKCIMNKVGTIDAPIGRKEGSIIERVVTEKGKNAITHYKVRSESNNYTLLDIELETGRTHQIRVHFSSIGHPIAGDDLYGASTKKIDRQALHCHEVSFEHPTTKRKMTFQVPMPKDMEQLMSH